METNAKRIKNMLASPAKSSIPQKKQKGDKNTTIGGHDRDASTAAMLAATEIIQTTMVHGKN